jgi:hypothetical protein
MYAQDGKGGSMSRTSGQYPLTRSTTFGKRPLERFILIEHVSYASRVSSAARESPVPALLLLKSTIVSLQTDGTLSGSETWTGAARTGGRLYCAGAYKHGTIETKQASLL